MITHHFQLARAFTKLTPNEASDPTNLSQAKLNMELHAKRARKYPALEVGDVVKPMLQTKFRKNAKF